MGVAASIASEGLTAHPRLTPIAWSWNPLHWFALAIYRSIGAPLPAQVIFARAPLLVVGHVLVVLTSEYGLSLDRRVRSLVRVFGSRINGCMFCDDLETRLALKSRSITREDADALATYASSERFGERERAALRYVEEIDTARQASNETFEALRRHFNEREIVEITWLNAVGNYLNLQARPLGLAPDGLRCGVRPAEPSATARNASTSR
jgi:AhpD family alkylhydroperoxidase